MKKINHHTLKNSSVLITIAFLVVLSFISIGFASYNQLTSFSGLAHVLKGGKVEITNISLVSSSNVQSSATPTFDEQNATFNLVFGGTDSLYQAVYQVTITNNSVYNYNYAGFNYNPTVTSANGTGVGTLNVTTTGISNGDVIAPGESKTFTITLDLTVSDPDTTYNAEVNSNISGSTNNTGNIIGSVSPTTGNLTGTNTLAQFTAEVINTYNYQKVFTLTSSNSNFIVVDSNGNTITSFTINANTTKDFTFYLKAKSDAIFLTNSETTTIVLGGNNITSSNIGTITLSVDIYVAPDTTKPTVGGASLAILDTSGSFTASWNRIDSGGTSITNYTLLLYNSSGTLVSTYNTNSDVTSHTYTSMSAATYYFVVYGTDAAGNTGSASASSATTANGYATKSASVAMKWVFSVTNSLTSMTSSGASTASLHQTYSATLKANTNYSLPTTITVTMGGTTLTSGSGYSYSSSSGAVSIPSVTGDITISGTATRNICLVKGTKILLADGTYKNIENINYDDLLLVYSYDTGKFTYEYPIWLEQTHTINGYTLITFSDGSTLKAVGFHGIYNYDLNRFVSIDNPKEFNIGSSVAIINSDHTGFNKVKVVSIKYIKKTVNYYHVVSTRYYNVIANNFLTTDGTVILSNLYGFNNNITWPDIRNNIMSNQTNLYDYSDFSDIIPEYMFKGMRMEEAKVLNKYGLDLNTFRYYLSTNQVNPTMVLSPIKDKQNQNKWMVTTSDDNVNILNKNNYLMTEGSNYLLKLPNNQTNFIGWLDSVDNKIYHPGDYVKIYCGTYFTAIYK
jgi:hypothetical protein